ncbi:MAG: choice-of-anchor B family protein [Crocinitomicaceae bacterium]|nr:choice-of-anchor B family protein [Crocinitomicaceae bacterium]
MKFTILALLAFLAPSLLFAQINMTQLGYLDIATMHNTELNDIWGYEDENGNEYALVGCTKGTSIVDVTDPANPSEILWIPGMTSIWRDIKTYGDYAYVTTEANEGLLIIDLNPLPLSTTLPTSIYTGPAGNEWYSAHNLYQADGYVYIFGSGRDNGGVIILDVATDPLNPAEVGSFEQWYIHDGFVRNDTGYFSHVNDGFFSIVDLSDKANVQLTDVIGTLTTSSNFTHNCWPSTDGQTLFTTDEVPNGYLDSYDISDPANPIFLDQIQSSPGNDIIPHNAHVLNNYLVTSYYTDGVVVHNISDPSNIVEIANFDTSPNYSGNTFNGCWGVYPFFSSTNIVASDIEEGLYILGLSPTLTSYLQGNITSAGTGQPINNAMIEILTTPTVDYSNVLGDYSIGTTNQGVYQVRYSANGYYADTLDINFVNGTIVTQNVALVQVPLFNITVTVLDQTTSLPIENAMVKVEHTLQNFDGVTDVNGQVTFGLFYEDNYKITAGSWGYINDCDPAVMFTTSNNTKTLYLSEGIYDDFTFDFGWTTSSNASAGDWVRETPVGTESLGITANPYFDDFNDCSTYAYLTGNGASTVGGDDIDDGSVSLISPMIDLSSYTYPVMSFSYWFFDGFGGGSTPNDSLAIYLSNGSETVQIASLGVLDVTQQWESMHVDVASLMSLTNQMQLTLVATDFPFGHVVKAGLDYFRIQETLGDNEISESQIAIYPNPATGTINIQGIQNGTIEIYDLSGRMVYNNQISSVINISELNSGMYMIRLKDKNGELVKIQKQLIR